MLNVRLQPFTLPQFRRRVFGQLWMLALQFLLGMLLNLIGSESTGAWHTAYVTVLIIHILNAIGLVEGGFVPSGCSKAICSQVARVFVIAMTRWDSNSLTDTKSAGVLLPATFTTI